MGTVEDTLLDRIDTLIEAQKGEQLLTTTATSLAIAELASRTEGLEKAVREIALEVQKLSLRLD
jgi:predicted sugar kinase